MKLILKLPKNKPPFIGILFALECEGAALHSDMVEKYGDKEYHVVFEILSNDINLRVACAETVTVYFYNSLTCDSNTLVSWLYMTKHLSKFNFGHIYKHLDKDTLVTARSQRKLFFIPVTKITVIEAEYNSELPYTTNNRKWD